MATSKEISKYLLIACALLLCALPRQSLAGFNTAQLIYNSMQVKCLDWKIIGLCFWLKCSPKCKIKTTPKISHYLPDLTVTNSPGQCPWQEATLLSLQSPENIASQLIAKTVGGNPGQGGRLGRYAMKFKDAMVIGNPAAKLGSTFNVRFLCKSQSKPMHIYFNSRQGLSALVWRGIDLNSLQGIGGTDLDRVESWKPGSRMIGRSNLLGNEIAGGISMLDNGWGSIYPRRGTVLNPNDVKAGAVIAQRAIEIVVRNPDGYHNVTPTEAHDDERWEVWGDSEASNYQQCQASGGHWQQEMHDTTLAMTGRCLPQRSVQQRDIGDEANDRWQMIYPKVESECSPFDQRARLKNDWSAGKASEDAAYGYNFWQKYKCCIPRSGLYLFSVEW